MEKFFSPFFFGRNVNHEAHEYSCLQKSNDGSSTGGWDEGWKRASRISTPRRFTHARNISTRGKFNIELAEWAGGSARAGICVIFVRVLIKKGYNKRFVYICYQFFRRAQRAVVCSALILAPHRRLAHRAREGFLRSLV
jgi:hypothetical protein